MYVQGGTAKAQYCKLGYVDKHAKDARNVVVYGWGDKRRACTVFDKEAQQLQHDSSLMLPHVQKKPNERTLLRMGMGRTYNAKLLRP
jgi:hypothetical protein